MSRGRCRGMQDLFGSEEKVDVIRAKEVCKTCPVKSECLDFALRYNERALVWGGMTPYERQRVQRNIKVPRRDVVSETG